MSTTNLIRWSGSVAMLGGLLIIIGFVLVMAASAVLASYFGAGDEQMVQELDFDRAVEAISADPGAWRAANWLFVVAGVLTAAGLALLALTSRQTLPVAGATLFAIGSAFWVIYCYLRIPDSNLSRTLLWMEAVFAWLSAGGLLLLGAAFLRGEFPRWVGYLHVGYGALFMLAFIFFGAQLYDFYPPQLPYLIALFAGIAAIRGARRADAQALNAP